MNNTGGEVNLPIDIILHDITQIDQIEDTNGCSSIYK